VSTFIQQKCLIICKNDFKDCKQYSRQHTIYGTKLCRIDTIGPAQGCFTDLSILKAKIVNNFKEIISSNFYQTALDNCYGLTLPTRQMQVFKIILSCNLA